MEALSNPAGGPDFLIVAELEGHITAFTTTARISARRAGHSDQCPGSGTTRTAPYSVSFR
jgi:hypothetical protein